MYDLRLRPLLRLLVLALLIMPAAAVPAAELGQPAAPLEIAYWGKGGPVNMAEGKGKNIYVIDFWATWCGPCMASVPKLSELARKYKDQGVVLVSVNSSEKQEDVEGFVKDKGGEVDYIVALDKEEKTSKAYMEAFGVNSIPHTFVVDKQGRIVWHGHPESGLEETLQALIDGSFDLEKVKNVSMAESLLPVYSHLVSATSEHDLVKAVFDRIVRYGAANRQAMLGLTLSSLGEAANDKAHLDLARTAMDLALKTTKDPDSMLLGLNARILKLEGKTEAAEAAAKSAEAVAKNDQEREMVKKLTSEGL